MQTLLVLYMVNYLLPEINRRLARDGSGMLVTANPPTRRGPGAQIWFVAADGKSERQVTNDLFDYRTVLTNPGQTLSNGGTLEAIGEEGFEARSFTGSQAAILTDNAHTAARILDGQMKGMKFGEENDLSFERFPHLAHSKTYQANQQTPDSAPTMTAIVTGQRTNNGVIAQSASAQRGAREQAAHRRIVELRPPGRPRCRPCSAATRPRPGWFPRECTAHG